MIIQSFVCSLTRWVKGRVKGSESGVKLENWIEFPLCCAVLLRTLHFYIALTRNVIKICTFCIMAEGREPLMKLWATMNASWRLTETNNWRLCCLHPNFLNFNCTVVVSINFQIFACSQLESPPSAKSCTCKRRELDPTRKVNEKF